MLFRDFGIMPERKPVVVVVGKPLPPPAWHNNENGFHPQVDRKTGEALNEDGKILNEYHHQYIEALEDLYKTYKNAPWNVPGRDRRKSLTIIS
jgi:hypothetical protein